MAIVNGRPINKQLMPHIIVPNVDEAIDFYNRAFEAVEIFRTLRPNGLGQRHHAHLRIGESVMAVTRENPDRAGPYVRSPHTVGGLNGFLELFVDDVDAWAARAEREGAEIFRKPEDLFFGDRYCQVVDPFGHLWAFSTPNEMLSAEECSDRMNAFYESLGATVVLTPLEKTPAMVG
jgi:PhnB protein